MSGNSQFRALAKRVERLERVTGEPEHKQALRKQRELEEVASQFKRAQADAKTLLLQDEASADELEAAIPFLDNLGLREFARLEADKKRTALELQQQLAMPLVMDTTLIENMRAAAADGSYYKWRETLPRPATELKPVPVTKDTAAISRNAMKAASEFTERQRQHRLDRVEPKVIAGDADAVEMYEYYFPDPSNGVVVS